MPISREVLRKFRSPGAVLILGLVLFVLGAKFLLIQKYGSDLPFWDQWDAEADRLYIPAAEGRLHAAEFFAPHNEHRIAFTKAVAFALLRMNGQWDARVQMTVNALLHVAAIALLLLAIRKEAPKSGFIAAIVFSLALFALPLSWENTLAGFQSQFYFLLLFSVLHLAGTFLYPPGSSKSWWAQVAGLCSVFSMGSGFFSAAVVAGLLTLQGCIRRSLTKEQVTLLAWNVSLTIVGVALMTPAPGHEVLKSHSLTEFIESFSLLVAWPSPYAAFFPLTLFPIGWALFRRAKTGPASSGFDFIFALAGWWFLQVVAIAYARGGDGHGLSPRYFDTLAISTLVTLLFWLDALVDLPRKLAARAALVGLAIMWLGVTLDGLHFQTSEAENKLLPPLIEANQSRIDTVAEFIATNDPHFYQARPWLDLPYPNAERLGRILSDKNLRPLLPSSVRLSLPVAAEAGENLGFARNGALGDRFFSPGRPGWSSSGRAAESPALFRSMPLERPTSRYLRISVTGQLSPTEGTLYLETPAHRYEIEAPRGTATAWKTVVVDSPDVPFRVIAESKPGAAFAFTDPVEVAFGSVLVRHVLKSGALFFWLGAACVAGPLLIFAAREGAKIRFNLNVIPQRIQARATLLTLAGVALVLFIRKTGVWLHPQFWAEDGQIFFEHAVQLGSSAIFTPYAGYHHFLLRCIANFATNFDIVWAPAVYVYASIAVTLGVCALVFSPRINLPFKPLIALAIVLVPHTGEVFLNLTNLQWITALGLLLIALKTDTSSRRHDIGDAILVFIFGITGPFIVFLLPLFALRVVRFRSVSSMILLATAALAAAIQIEALIHAPASPDGAIGLGQALEIAGLRTFGRFVLGGPLSVKIGISLAAVLGWAFGLSLATLSFPLRERRWEHLMLWSTLTMLVVAAVLRFRGMEELLLQYKMGDRYFFVPTVIAAWILISVAPRWPRIAFLVGLVAVLTNAVEFRFPPYQHFDWKADARKIAAGQPVHIVVNPGFVAFDHQSTSPDDKAGSRGRFGEHLLAYIATWLALTPILLGQIVLWSRHAAYLQAWRLFLALAATCLLGYASFWAYFTTPSLGVGFLAAVWLGTIVLLVDERQDALDWLRTQTHARDALLVCFLIGIGYLALLHLYGSSRTLSDLVEHRFLDRLPSDDSIPGVVAERLLKGISPRGSLGDWQSSDRPPLQTGIILLGSSVGRLLKINFESLSQAAGLWFQLLWVPAVWLFCQQLGLTKARAFGIVLTMSTIGFFVINTLFVWPKLGGSALLFAAFCLWFRVGERRMIDAVLCGILAGLSCLAHAGLVFSLLALGIVGLFSLRRTRWPHALVVAVSFVVTVSPWLAYQKFYEPPGLLKWHLGGATAADSREVPETTGSAYRQLGWRGTLEQKMDNVLLSASGDYAQLLDFSPARAAERRANQFFRCFLSLWHWNLGWFLLPWIVTGAWIRKSPQFRLLLSCAAWGTVTYLVWVGLLFGDNATMLQQSSYTMHLSWFGVLLISTLLWNVRAFAALAALQVAGFLTTWLPANPAIKSPILIPAVGTLLVVAATLILWFVAAWRSERAPVKASAIGPEFGSDRHHATIA